MNKSIHAFADSRKFFRYYLDCKLPLSYDDWVKLPDEHKAAALFVQFYQEILSAWNRCYSSTAISDDSAVSIILQYLQKNVNKIVNDRNRYSCEYVYTVAHNCLSKVTSRLSKRTRARIDGEKKSVSLDEELVADETAVVDIVSLDLEVRNREFWRHVSLVCTEDELVLIECIINREHIPDGMDINREELTKSLQRKLTGFSDFIK